MKILNIIAQQNFNTNVTKLRIIKSTSEFLMFVWFDGNNFFVPSGLHDNPWVCDCRIYDLVQFQKSPTLSVAFIDTRLRCSAPESESGILFSDVELRRCQLPRIHTAVARVRSAVGNNVLLRCGTIGVPIPDLTWRRADGKLINGTGESEIRRFGSAFVTLCSLLAWLCMVITVPALWLNPFF